MARARPALTAVAVTGFVLVGLLLTLEKSDAPDPSGPLFSTYSLGVRLQQWDQTLLLLQNWAVTRPGPGAVSERLRRRCRVRRPPACF